MNRLAELRMRREQLIARAAEQRAEFVRELRPLSGPIALAERGLAGIVWVRRHPLVLAIAVAAVVVITPRRILGGLRRGAMLLRIGQTLLPVIMPLLASLAASRIRASRTQR